MAAMAYQKELFISVPGAFEEIRTQLDIKNNIIVFIHLISFIALQKCKGLYKDVVKNSEECIKML